MTNEQRIKIYLRTRSQFTPAQRRRLRKTVNKALKRAGVS